MDLDMNRIEAVIFDMDGVLINSESLWKQAELEVFTSLGVNVCEEDCALTASMTTSQVTKFWFDKFPWSNIPLFEVECKVIDRVIELINSTDCHIENIKPVITRLKSQNYKIGLATNSPYKIIPNVLHKIGVFELFDCICSAEFVKNGKPDPEIYLKAAKELNVIPEKCIAVEDSYGGITAAKKAGMNVVVFTNNQKNPPQTVADFTIDNFLEFDEIFLNEKFCRTFT